jgi:anthranilate phosphoribosyltransferase
MPLRRAFVIHGAEGWDEATPVGEFICFDVCDGNVTRRIRDPLDAGIERCTAADLQGGEPEDNCARLCSALAGDDTPAHRDALTLGAALALEVTGTVATLADGVEAARAALSAGKGRLLLQRLAEFKPSP